MGPNTSTPKKVGKVKSKGAGKPPNKAMHSRVSYLYQAATYLATIEPAPSNVQIKNVTRSTNTEIKTSSESETQLQPASRRLVSDLRDVSLQAQLRMSPTMKHSICKNCDTLLIDGSTCTSEVENKSKGGKKPWADILLRRCNTCGLARRYPMAAERQKRRPQRSLPEVMDEVEVTDG